MNIKTPSRSQILVIYWLNQNKWNEINWMQVTFTLIKTKLLLKISHSCRNYNINRVFWSLLLIRKRHLAAEKNIKKDGYPTPVWNIHVFKEIFKTSLNSGIYLYLWFLRINIKLKNGMLTTSTLHKIIIFKNLIDINLLNNITYS